MLRLTKRSPRAVSRGRPVSRTSKPHPSTSQPGRTPGTRSPLPAPGGGRGSRAAWPRSGTTLDHRRDRLERHGEHVVQHEGEPLGRRQRVEHHQQRQPGSASNASCSGSPPSSWLMIGSGTCTSRGSSRRDSRVRSMFRHTRATTVVNHPARFSTLPVSARLRRSQASWTASSASLSDPTSDRPPLAGDVTGRSTPGRTNWRSS